MKKNTLNSRRNFIGVFATGALGTGISMLPQSLMAEESEKNFSAGFVHPLDTALKEIGKKAHPVGFDVSQANPWGFIWSNVYYMTNEQTGTTNEELGVVNVMRHHGMVFGMNDATFEKYKLGEFAGLVDPITKKPPLKNPFYIPEKDTFPSPKIVGIKGLQEKGALFCVCDMARKMSAKELAKKMNLKEEDVYKDLVEGTLPGVIAAPSGVWALGRFAENKIAYIDASMG